MPHPSRTSPTSLVVNRPIDLGEIEAVGFDLDHTLALYDDAAVNALAMAEALHLLVEHRGYRARDIALAAPVGDAGTARALAIDLANAHVVKLDASRRVRVARRAGEWLQDDEIGRAHPERVPERDDVVHPLSSAFDVPTLWLFEAVTRGHAAAEHVAPALDAVRVCRDVRQMLDLSHTRGELKSHLARDLERFVTPVAGATERLLEWRRAGKRLFVVTNSDLAFATEVLDLVIGPAWRDIFSVVSTSSGKPSFFAAADARAAAPRGDVVREGATARELEAVLGARGERVLYVGDNARADIAPARSFGWKTVHVVAELSAGDQPAEGWGSPFLAGGEPSWFARVVGEYADAVCDRVDRLLACEPDRLLDAGESA
ncbi:MAG TPA: 5'-nucleotidase domain-containing protein [Candidatus Krumholzibacteria bacterium]|nr:5'-nucleotidase domain-containing protein [Candidatus Krumholzibacteria bacterium]